MSSILLLCSKDWKDVGYGTVSSLEVPEETRISLFMTVTWFSEL